MQRPSLTAIRGFDRGVYVVALGQLLNVFGSGLVYPFATVHFHLRVGIALSVIGLGFLVKNITTAIATGVGGTLADQFGRKPVMVASMGGNAITLSAYAFVPVVAEMVPEVTAGWAFVGVSAASGVTNGLYTPAAQAYTADLTAGNDRDQAFSLLKVANNVGFGSGFVVGGILYEVANVAIFIADGITSGVVAILLAIAVKSVYTEYSPVGLRETINEWTLAIRKRRVLWLAGLNVGFAVMYAQMQTTVPVVAKDRLGLEAAQLGTLYVLNPVTLVILQIPLVAAIASWRRTRGLVVSAGMWAVSMLAVWVTFLLNLPALIGIAFLGMHLVVRTLGEILHSPLSTSLMSDLGSKRERGSQLSLLEIAKRLGFGLGAFVGGIFFDYGFAGLLWPTLAAVCILLAVGLLLLEHHVTPKENGVPPADKSAA